MAVMDSLLKDLEINEEMKNSKYLPTMIVTFFKNLELAKTRGWRASKVLLNVDLGFFNSSNHITLLFLNSDFF